MLALASRATTVATPLTTANTGHGPRQWRPWAAAMAVKDGVDVNMFGDDRTAAKALTSVAYHIRRPNEALFQQFRGLQVEGFFIRATKNPPIRIM